MIDAESDSRKKCCGLDREPGNHKNLSLGFEATADNQQKTFKKDGVSRLFSLMEENIGRKSTGFLFLIANNSSQYGISIDLPDRAFIFLLV